MANCYSPVIHKCLYLVIMQTCEKCLEQIHPQALRCKWCNAKTPYNKSRWLKENRTYTPLTRYEKNALRLILVFFILLITTCSLALMGY